MRATMRGLSLSDEGFLRAESLRFSARGGPQASLGPLVFSFPGGQALIEWEADDGWTYEIYDMAAEGGTLALSCFARSQAIERRPGSSAYSRVGLVGLPVDSTGRPDWATASIGPLSVNLDLARDVDILSAASGTAELDGDGVPCLRADLILSGLPGNFSILFPGALVRGRGRLELPASSRGSAELNLPGGCRLRLEGLGMSEGAWLSGGSLRLPETLAPGTELNFGPGGIRIDSFKTLSLKSRPAPGPFVISLEGFSFSCEDASFAHVGRSSLDIGRARPLLSDPSLGMPWLRLRLEDGRAGPSSRAIDPPEPLAGYGGRLKASSIAWEGGSLSLGGIYSAPGILEGAQVPIGPLELLPDGSLIPMSANAVGPAFAALGGSCTLSGLSLLPDGGMRAAALAGDLGGRAARDFRISDLSIGADGRTRAGAGWIGNIAGAKGFTVDSVSGDASGLILAGRMGIRFSSGTHFIDMTFPTDSLLLSSRGELRMEPVVLEGRSYPAFLGLHFSRVSAALLGDELSFILDGGVFKGSSFWPSGGRVEGLGVNLRTQKYVLDRTVFEEPASFSWGGADFSLTSLDGAMDDAYLFSGRAILPDLGGAPWGAAGEYPLRLLRLDEYGNPRGILIELGGKAVDILPFMASRR